MNSFYYDAGIRIRQLREFNHYSREKLAELADISTKFLYEIETGQKGFSAVTLYRISKALLVNCEYILSGESQSVYDDEEVLNVLRLYKKNQMGDLANILRLINKMI